jgi:hypothetical protein
MQDRRFYFKAQVRVSLADGAVEDHTLEDYVQDVSEEMARQSARSVIKEIVMDWGCDKVDAPVLDCDVLGITWTGAGL